MILSEVYRRAELALRLGHVEFARTCAAEVLRYFPEDLRALRIATEAALEVGDAQTALRHAQARLCIAPDDTSALATVGVLLAARGETERALATLNRAYQLSPNRHEVLEPLHELRRRVRHHADTLDPAPRLATARWRMRRHEYGGALTELRRAETETDDDDLLDLIYLLRCEALWRSGRHDQAEELARDLLHDYPSWLKPRLVLGALLLADPLRAEEGVMLLHDALGSDPSQTLARPLFAESPIELPYPEHVLTVPLPARGLVTPDEVEIAARSLPPDAFVAAPDDWAPPESTATLPGDDLELLDEAVSAKVRKRRTDRRPHHLAGDGSDGLAGASDAATSGPGGARRNGQSPPDIATRETRGWTTLDPPSLVVDAARATLTAPVADHLERAQSEPEIAAVGSKVADQTSRFTVMTPSDGTDAAIDDTQSTREAATIAFSFEPFPSNTPVRTVELWVTSRSRLATRYGPQGFRQVAAALERSARELAAIGARVHILVVDDEESTGLYGQRPVPASKADAVRRLIDSVGAEIVKEDRNIDAILLIGGDDVLPFFRLSNPTDDDDSCVLSDNPYGATSQNLYLPNVAVGRLPDAEEPRPAFLCDLIEAIPIRRARPVGFAGGCLLMPWYALAQRLPAAHTSAAVFASAAAQATATEVCDAIGGRPRLELCPPTTADSIDARQISGMRLLYFDLLGGRDSARWYGQTDRSHPNETAALSIAFEPHTLDGAQVDDGVVYAACSYSAYVLGRNAETCTALRFLAEGTAAVVGSTGIAYGVLRPPLSGADLLGEFLGRHLLDGQSIGEALIRAKADYYAVTRERQGWLDGDDQKTLLEFVLYGDPLVTVRPPPRSETLPAATGGSTALLCQSNPADRQTAAVNSTIERRVVDHLTDLCGERPTRLRFVRRVHCRGECTNECHQGVDRPTHPHEAVLCATATRTLVAADGVRLRRYMRVTLDRTGHVSKTLVSK